MQPELIGGRYRVASAIGQGGMGTVWLCRDETLHRDVAVKGVGLLPGESVTDSARAFREARSSAALSHRNVVTVFDVVEESGRIWLVMEHVPGRSLSEIIKQDGPLEPAVVARLGAQVADGLAAAHAAGTTHRDVKPGNVLVREDGVAKISDFGIARNVADPALTQSGFLTGTPTYFSPELAQGADPGPATDVWALGATLYYAVEGHPPYEQRTNPVAVLHDIASGQPARPRRAEFLEPALLRMMDRDPESRWSMEDAAHVLHRLAEEHRPDSTLKSTVQTPAVEEPVVAAAEATRPPAPVRSERPSGRPSERPRQAAPAAPAPVARSARRRAHGRGPLVVFLVVAALALAIGGLVYVTGHRSDSPQADAGGGSSRSPSTSANPSKSATDGGSTSGTSGSGPAAKEAFVRDYYAAAPGGTDKAWAMLGPGEQAQGRESYDHFWRTIESVDVQEATARPGSDSVDVTLVYHGTDGKVSTERKTEGLVASKGGGFLIDSDTPAG